MTYNKIVPPLELAKFLI